MCDFISRYIAVVFFILFSQNIFAEKNHDEINNEQAQNLCPAENDASVKHFQPRVFSAEDINNTEISADFTKSSSDGSTSLDGNVVIEQHLLHITADHANYDKQQEILEFTGNVQINTETLSLQADAGSVKMNGSDKRGEFNNIKFFVPGSNMKGKAETIRSGENKHSTLNNASITSCNLLDPDWLISADEIRLDHEDEYGSADNVVIRFKDIPFLYTPYIEFPTSDKRRSGLLFPEFGTSTSRGAELAIPWYWNIAANHDAVLTPRIMEKRGQELGGNYRYLTQSSNGELKGAYLPDDEITQEDRYQVRYQQHSRLLPNLLLDIDLQDISDPNYFNDFANNLGSTSQTHLYRDATLNYSLDNWQLRLLAQDIKTIDTTTLIANRPYERLPQLLFNGEQEIANSSIFFTLDSEYVDFTHEDDTKITGARSTIRPGLHLPLTGTAWFFDPAVKFSHTHYDVGTQGDSTTPGTSLTVEKRNLPISSIDAGLFFERYLDNGYQQTLEPRLYYLNIPFEDQNNTPLFDTSIPNFSVAQLFRDNRFVGGDRIGDTNQLTFALASRMISPNTGDEFIRASIGQIYYFEDRHVSLDGTIDTSKQSDVIAELDTNWGNWKSNIDLQWDTTNSELSQENYSLHYMSDARHILNIGYRKRLENRDIDIEQTDTSLVYAFNREYNIFARWNYSLKENKDIDIIGGFSYDSCCWSIQLLAQRRLINTATTTIANDTDYDNSLLVQFVFKGLGSLSGSKARTTLEQSIYGYKDILQ